LVTAAKVLENIGKVAKKITAFGAKNRKFFCFVKIKEIHAKVTRYPRYLAFFSFYILGSRNTGFFCHVKYVICNDKFLYILLKQTLVYEKKTALQAAFATGRYSYYSQLLPA
jgi:hypothetical protein